MQGKKDYSEKLFTHFQLSDHVPETNFYRRLKSILDLNYLRKSTSSYYGSCGQKSIDPVVFFKLILVGYLENIVYDRALMRHSKMRLDIIFFLDYDIDEPLPCHSTLSRTRDLFPEKIFIEAFERVLGLCVEAGMVTGHTQVIDSAPIKANASMDGLEPIAPKASPRAHMTEVILTNATDIDQKNEKQPRHSSSDDKSPRDDRQQGGQSADYSGLHTIAGGQQKTQKQNKGSHIEPPKKIKASNKTHRNPVDPDARMSIKPGKAYKLNYTSQLSVDTAEHVITDISAHLADRKDSQDLIEITNRLKKRLFSQGLLMSNVLADTNYSSGENYAYLAEQGLTAYMPPPGTYKGGPIGFVYDQKEDYYICPQGKKATFISTTVDKDNSANSKLTYATKREDCRDCPIQQTCIKNRKEKRFTITAHKRAYDQAKVRQSSKIGRIMKNKRQSTVEPVFGTLTQYLGLRKINTRGLKKANKVMLMSAMAYNIKKYLKFIERPVLEVSQMVSTLFSLIIRCSMLIPTKQQVSTRYYLVVRPRKQMTLEHVS